MKRNWRGNTSVDLKDKPIASLQRNLKLKGTNKRD